MSQLINFHTVEKQILLNYEMHFCHHYRELDHVGKGGKSAEVGNGGKSADGHVGNGGNPFGSEDSDEKRKATAGMFEC